MKTRSFLGRKISFEQLEKVNDPSNYPDDLDNKLTFAEIYLNNFECCPTDRIGNNAYSIQLYLNHDRIVKIIRVGHCHMCGGQGSDEEISRFPHNTLEKEAHSILTTLLL